MSDEGFRRPRDVGEPAERGRRPSQFQRQSHQGPPFDGGESYYRHRDNDPRHWQRFTATNDFETGPHNFSSPDGYYYGSPQRAAAGFQQLPPHRRQQSAPMARQQNQQLLLLPHGTHPESTSANPYPRINDAELLILEHVAGCYNFPESLVEEFTQTLLALNPDAELPAWLSARLLLRNLTDNLGHFRSSEGSFAVAERLLGSLESLANHVSRDPSLPAAIREALGPPDNVMADLRQYMVLATIQRDLASDDSRGGIDPVGLVEAIVQRFFPPQVAMSEDEMRRGMHLVAQIRNNRRESHPIEVISVFFACLTPD